MSLTNTTGRLRYVAPLLLIVAVALGLALAPLAVMDSWMPRSTVPAVFTIALPASTL